MDTRTRLLALVDVLKKYTDDDNHLDISEIELLLKNNYDITVDKKTLRSDLNSLVNSDLFDIDYNSDIERRVTDKASGKSQIQYIRNSYRLLRKLSLSEVQYILIAILSLQNISDNQKNNLVRNFLSEVTSETSRNSFKYASSSITSDLTGRRINNEFFLSIETITEAITFNRKIQFNYVDYYWDNSEKSRKKRYIVSPYKILLHNGQYYLLCNHIKYDNLTAFRIDKIKSIELTEDPLRPLDDLNTEFKSIADLDKYTQSHWRMYFGDAIEVTMKIDANLYSAVLEAFGDSVSVIADKNIPGSTSGNRNKGNDTVLTELIVKIYSVPDSALAFALSHSPKAIILSPNYLVAKVKQCLMESLAIYEN